MSVSPIPLISVSVFMLKPCCFNDYSSNSNDFTARFFLKTSEVTSLVQKMFLKDSLVRDRSGDNPAPILAGILTWSRGGLESEGLSAGAHSHGYHLSMKVAVLHTTKESKFLFLSVPVFK